MRDKLIIALVLVVPALLLLPLERGIHAERAEMKFGGPQVTLKMRDQIGQGMAIGLLAGFRGVVADFLWIQGQAYWQEKKWVRLHRNVELVTTLQPQSLLFWDEGAWHIAYNAAFAARYDKANRTEAEGIKRQREWWDRGVALLERGAVNVPTRYELPLELGRIYRDKYKDDCKAAEHLQKAAGFSDAPTYVGRYYARTLERCGDRDGAYQYWKVLWSQDHDNPKQLWYIIEREIRRLEAELQVPDEARVFPAQKTS